MKHSGQKLSWWRVLLCIVLWAQLALADTGKDEATSTAHDAARELQFGMQRSVSTDPATLVPGYSTTVPQTELYDAGAELTPMANSSADGNEAATMVGDTAFMRQNIVLDKDTDPMLLHSRTITDAARSITGIGEPADSGCTTIQPAVVSTTETERCTSWNASGSSCSHNCYCPGLEPVIQLAGWSGNLTVQYEHPQFTISSNSTQQRQWNLSWEGRGSGYPGCGQHDAEVSFTVTDPDRVAEFILQDTEWQDHLRLELNGRQLFIGPHSGDTLQAEVIYKEGYRTIRGTRCHISLGIKSPSCLPSSGNHQCCVYTYSTIRVNRAEYYADYGIQRQQCAAGQHQRQPAMDLRPWLRQGLNTLRIRVLAASAGGTQLRFRVRTRCSCNNDDSISDGGCARQQQQAADGTCQLQQQNCLDNPSLCSRQSNSYICLGTGLQEEPYCAELRQRGCVWSGSQCVDTDDKNACIEYEQQYSCGGTPQPQPEIEDCGARISCIGPDCTSSGYSPSSDFAKAAAHLEAIGEVGADFDKDTLAIFTGAGYRCKKTILGFANCCRDSGWGVSLGLSRCSASERELGEKRQAGQCHYVGSYKRGSLFNKKRYQSFCCFSSKLGRVVQQQGRVQLGVDWGPATGPECRGLSTDELAILDFESFDLGEVEQDMVQQALQAEYPDDSVLGERLRQSLRQTGR